jgi:hypothetical protein
VMVAPGDGQFAELGRAGKVPLRGSNLIDFGLKPGGN